MKFQPDTQTYTNSFASLSDDFYSRVSPTPFESDPVLIHYNHAVAELLGLDADVATHPDSAAIFSGKKLPDGVAPLAMLYAGHQFGQYVPELGDGRAIMLGEVLHPENDTCHIIRSHCS